MNPRILGALLVLAACSGPTPPDSETPVSQGTTAAEAAQSPDLVPGEHLWTTADGIELPYTVAGEGDPTVVLVHCGMCNRSFWSEQMPVLSERYRVVSLDLPGHGEAGTERAQWTVAAYGDDVAGLLRHLDLRDVVLVGHSMGGPVSLRAAALSEGRVRGIVAVETLRDAELDFSTEEVRAFVKAFESDYAGTCASWVSQMFPEEGVEEIESYVREASCRPDRSSLGIALMQDSVAIDMPAWLAGAGVPIRAINAAAPNPTQVETNQKYADFDVVLMEGVGHYPHMTRPEEFNPLLLQAVADLGAASE